jgi:hypothetical protein
MQAHELLFEALLMGQSKPLPFDWVAPDEKPLFVATVTTFTEAATPYHKDDTSTA